MQGLKLKDIIPQQFHEQPIKIRNFRSKKLHLQIGLLQKHIKSTRIKLI